MKRINKILALIIGVVMLLSAMCIPALAYSYPMAVTIYYKNEAGYSVATSISTTINAADTDKPTWASPNISGYALKNESDAVVTYEMLDKSFPASNYDRNGSGTYTVIYQKLYTHAVKCVNAKTGAFIWSCTTEGKTGQSYSITLPSITGITPAKSTVTGTFGSSDTSETVYYYPTIYTVTYNASGGSGAPGSQTKEHGQTLTLSSRTPTRYGYSFLGWSRSSTATSASFSPGGSYTGNYSATLYAVWDPDQYTVTLNANGGSFSVSELTKYYGKTLQLPSEIPVRDGYLFLGWSTDKNATTANYSAGGNYTLNSSCTLYAVWEKELERYAVYFNANGGTDAPATMTKTEGVTLILPEIIPLRNGYYFMSFLFPKKVLFGRISTWIWKQDLMEDYPDLSDEEYETLAEDMNDGYLGDERANLDVMVGDEILVIGDIGRWDGRCMGYKYVESGNISDCLYGSPDCYYCEWFVDRDGEFRSTQIHHDGTNYMYYRKWKDGVSFDERDELIGKLYNGSATMDDIDAVTEKLGRDIGKVYGWYFPDKRLEERTKDRRER